MLATVGFGTMPLSPGRAVSSRQFIRSLTVAFAGTKTVAHDLLSRRQCCHRGARSKKHDYSHFGGTPAITIAIVFTFNKLDFSLQNLEQWTLRMSWLDLQLMFKQFNNNSPELSQWLDTVAKASIDVFQLNSPSNSPRSEDKK